MSSKKKEAPIEETPIEDAQEATAPAEETKDETAALTEELEKLKAELAGERDKYLRLMAEYDNFRKRSSRERDNIYADVKADTLSKLLPIYDNLERALAQETQDEAYRKGVEMTMNQFNDALGKLGVTAIPALGEKFDPELHNAVMHTEDEAFGENEVAEVFQKGFKLNDKVIRFAMVKVAN